MRCILAMIATSSAALAGPYAPAAGEPGSTAIPYDFPGIVAWATGVHELLRGRTAELIVTMDTPRWYNRWIYRRPGYNEMKRTILGFCGIKTVRVREYAVVRHSSRDERQRWVAEVAQLGRRAAG